MRRHPRQRFAAWLVTLAVLCPLGAMAQTLTVSAAASLAEALRDIAPLFEASRPGAKLRLNIAASGTLLQQIEAGAPVDVFVAADEDSVSRGIQRRLLDADSRRVVAANSLVLIRPARGTPALHKLNDLQRPDVRRVAVGKPASVPAGRYAQQALVAARLWESLRAKIVPADSVRQVLDYVARGEVEAGFVYATDAALMGERVQVVLTATGHEPIRYPATVATASRQKALAQAFVEFLGTPPAQAALRQRGFAAP